MNTNSEIPATPDWIDEKALFAEFLTRDLVFCDGLGRERSRYNARDLFAANGFEHEDVANLFDDWMLELEQDDHPASTLHWLIRELEQAAFVLERFKETFEEMMRERVIDSHPDDPNEEIYSPAAPVTTAPVTSSQRVGTDIAA